MYMWFGPEISGMRRCAKISRRAYSRPGNNHRAYTQLSTRPSRLIYRSVMGSYRARQAQYLDSVKGFNIFLKAIVPDLPSHHNRIMVMVTLPASWVSLIGTSARNIAHVRWAVTQAIKAIKDTSLKNLHGGPIEILMMPYIRAQVQSQTKMVTWSKHSTIWSTGKQCLHGSISESIGE